MAYIRWSDKSDVYSYHSIDGGYETMVLEQKGRCHGFYGLEFKDRTILGLKKRLLNLRQKGYRVPKIAITRINVDIKLQCGKDKRR